MAKQSLDEAVVIDEELDLTNYHLSCEALSSVPIPSSLTSIDLTANRLTEIDDRIIKLPGLRKLSLRQNLLASAAAIRDLASVAELEQLVLHDNQLEQFPPVLEMTALTQLDVSYNQIRSLASLAEMRSGNLSELYVACNKISEIQGLGSLTRLRVLELGGNRIRNFEGLESLQSLEELWLGRNRISSIQGLASLTSLRRLSLQSNRLESMKGVGECPCLQELYLSHNGIQQIEDLDNLRCLEILDASNNQISEIRGLACLSRLKDLWLNNNRIESFGSLGQELVSQRESLVCIYLAGNPAAAADANPAQGLRDQLVNLLPKLEQIDSDVIG